MLLPSHLQEEEVVVEELEVLPLYAMSIFVLERNEKKLKQVMSSLLEHKALGFEGNFLTLFNLRL